MRATDDPTPTRTPGQVNHGMSPAAMQVIRYLIDTLAAGGFSIGKRLPSERQLSSALGISRSAVRDAVQSLGLLGILERRQGDGTYLLSPDSDFLPTLIEWALLLGDRRVMDLVEARKMLETGLAGLAATRRTEDQLRALRALIESMKEPGLNAEAYIELDVRFHLCIAEASHNMALVDMLRSITSVLRVWMTQALESGNIRSSLEWHRKIFRAIERKDAEAAQAAMRSHLDVAEQRLRSTLDSRILGAGRPRDDT
jgi:GntR family transcriptional repressor for pyruvate dehydrogenase complex